SLYHYVYYRDLHSFPTRRSSDLRVCWRSGSTRQVFRVFSSIATRVAQSGSHVSVGDLVCVEGCILQRGGQTVLAARSLDRIAHRDRKSTRLNSSHQIISYAVFCL